MKSRFVVPIVLPVVLLLCGQLFGQAPTQIKYILTTTTSVILAWDFNVADETLIDDFVVQRTAFATTSTITSPYSVETIVAARASRTFTYSLPTGLTAGQMAFFRIISRKAGIADSTPSNVIEAAIAVTAPPPTNFRFQ
jgi:hypothetical protein